MAIQELERAQQSIILLAFLSRKESIALETALSKLKNKSLTRRKEITDV